MIFQKNLPRKVWVLRNASLEKRSFNTSTPYIPCFGSKLLPPKTHLSSAVASFPWRHLPAASFPWYKIRGNMAASGGVCAGGHLGVQMRQSLLYKILCEVLWALCYRTMPIFLQLNYMLSCLSPHLFEQLKKNTHVLSTIVQMLDVITSYRSSCKRVILL
jgi:hypothetical protein